MICRNCNKFEEILMFEKNLVGSYMDVLIDFTKYSKKSKFDIHCNRCGNKIYKGEYYLEEDDCNIIREDLQKQLAENVMGRIESCEECGHGQFIEGLKNSVYNTFNEKGDDPEAICEELIASTLLGDLIFDVCDFDDDITEGVINYISCPNCPSGTGENYDEKIDYGEFNYYTTIYTNEDIEEFNHSFYGDDVKTEIQTEIFNIAMKCSYQELVDLKEEYQKNPLLINNSSLIKISDSVKNMYNKGKWFELNDFYTLYRARINDKLKVAYSMDEMCEPLVEITSHGRYNPVGFPVLYLANSKDVIKREVKIKKNECYNIGIFKIEKGFKLFKINPFFSWKFIGFINEAVPSDKENSVFKEQYIITNIMSLIIKNAGYDGVAYLSTKDSRYANFCIFEYEKSKDIKLLDVLVEI